MSEVFGHRIRWNVQPRSSGCHIRHQRSLPSIEDGIGTGYELLVHFLSPFVKLLILLFLNAHQSAVQPRPKVSDYNLKVLDYNLKVSDCNRKISDYNLKVSDYNLKVSDCNLKVSDYNLKVSDYNLKVSDCNLKVSDYNLKVSDYNLKVSDYNLKVWDGGSIRWEDIPKWGGAHTTFAYSRPAGSETCAARLAHCSLFLLHKPLILCYYF
jgi:hypothetical protein